MLGREPPPMVPGLPTHHGIYTPPYPPGYTDQPAHPCRTAAAVTDRCSVAALTRGVAERNIRNGRVTVVTVTITRFTVRHPFHCWMRKMRTGGPVPRMVDNCEQRCAE